MANNTYAVLTFGKTYADIVQSDFYIDVVVVVGDSIIDTNFVHIPVELRTFVTIGQ